MSERQYKEKVHAHADIQVYFETTVIQVVECICVNIKWNG